MAYLLLFYANFQRFISNVWCSKSKRIALLSKGKTINFIEPIAFIDMSVLYNKLFTHFKNTLIQDSKSKLKVNSDIIIIVMNTDKKISVVFF